MVGDLNFIFWELKKFLDEKLNGRVPTDEERIALVDEFMETHYPSLRLPGQIAPDNATTVDDYLDLAYDAPTVKKRREYIKKAEMLEPDNVDVKIAKLLTDHEIGFELLGKLEPLIEEEKKYLESAGLFRNEMGNFWLIDETRPYMQLLKLRLVCLRACGMKTIALKEALEMLRLNKDDTQGLRFAVMVLAASLEDERTANKVARKYKTQQKSAFFSLPLAVLYFKLMKLDQAKEYIEQMKAVYGVTALRKFIKPIINKDLDVICRYTDTGTFRPGEIDELYCAFGIDDVFYITELNFFRWFLEQIKPQKRAKKKTENKVPHLRVVK